MILAQATANYCVPVVGTGGRKVKLTTNDVAICFTRKYNMHLYNCLYVMVLGKTSEVKKKFLCKISVTCSINYNKK